MQDISLSYQQIQACGLIELPIHFRPALDYLGLVLETDIPKDLPHLELDQTKIRQALFNLLRNAQEAIQHAHGKIQIAASLFQMEYRSPSMTMAVV